MTKRNTAGIDCPEENMYLFIYMIGITMLDLEQNVVLPKGKLMFLQGCLSNDIVII